jgi:hypothetical protein
MYAVTFLLLRFQSQFSSKQIHWLPGCPPRHIVASDRRIETALRLAVLNGHRDLVAKCLLGGGVKGDAAALSIAVARNDIDVLLLLLQSDLNSTSWESKDALRLPLARLLTLPFPSDDDEDCIRSVGSASTGALPKAVHWAYTQASPQQCLLLDQIAEGCPYTPPQLHRAIEAAVSAGLNEVSEFFLKKMIS